MLDILLTWSCALMLALMAIAVIVLIVDDANFRRVSARDAASKIKRTQHALHYLNQPLLQRVRKP